jgi:two-component system, OmpR family, response regulator
MGGARLIYVLEDDGEIRELVGSILSANGFEVCLADRAEAFWAMMLNKHPDLVILDVMLPGEDGLSVCARLQKDTRAPILMMSGRVEPLDRVIGLEIGADDYLCKPFNDRELVARVRAMLRRSRRDAAPVRGPVYEFASWTLDSASRRLAAREADVEVPLPPGQYDLLLIFVTQPQTILSRETLMDGLSGRELDVFDRSIDVQVSRLRRNLDDAGPRPAIIQTIRNGGYFFRPKVTIR